MPTSLNKLVVKWMQCEYELLLITEIYNIYCKAEKDNGYAWKK